MGKIGEFEETIIAEPLKEPLPAERVPAQVPAVPANEPAEVSQY
ncbi:MAG: hypothetical protein AB1552_03800 [Nitrospirota bacterium]